MRLFRPVILPIIDGLMYGCEKIADLLERDDRLRRQVIEIREQLYGIQLARA